MPFPATPREFQVSPADAGRPLAGFLRDRLELSGRRAKTLLDGRNVFVNGKRVWMAKHSLCTGDTVAVRAPPPSGRPGEAVPILYRDEWLVAVDKPPGLVSDRHTDSVEARLRRQLDLPDLRALHRLDRDTSGVLLFNRRAAERKPYLNLFKNRDIDKTYQAVFRGRLPSTDETVDIRLDGKEAVTYFHILEQKGTCFHAECRIPTGRKHQIRRHAMELDCVVVGDRQYGLRRGVPKIEQAVARQMLHAASVRFPCPHTGADLQVRAPIPGDFQAVLSRFGLKRMDADV